MHLKRKNFFVLLEILIAFSLVSFSIFPFLRYPHNAIKKQLDFLFAMQLKNEGLKELAKLQVQLYQNDPDLMDRIFQEKKTQAMWKKKEAITVRLSPNIQRNYTEKIYLHWDKKKKSTDGTIFSLVKIEVQFFEKKKRISTTKTQIVAQKRVRTAAQ